MTLFKIYANTMLAALCITWSFTRQNSPEQAVLKWEPGNFPHTHISLKIN